MTPKDLARVYLDYATHMRINTLVELDKEALCVHNLFGLKARMRLDTGEWQLDRGFQHPAFVVGLTGALVPIYAKWAKPVLQFYNAFLPSEPHVLAMKAGRRPVTLPKPYADALPVNWKLLPIIAYEVVDDEICVYCERGLKIVGLNFKPKDLVRVLSDQEAEQFLLAAWEELMGR